MLYQLVLFPVTVSNPKCPHTTTFLTFCVAFHIFVLSVVRDFKFDYFKILPFVVMQRVARVLLVTAELLVVFFLIFSFLGRALD